MQKSPYVEELESDGGAWSCTWRNGASRCSKDVTEMLTMPAYEEARLILNDQMFMRVLCPDHIVHVLDAIEDDQIEPEFQ